METIHEEIAEKLMTEIALDNDLQMFGKQYEEMKLNEISFL